jgi:hypothetical protein
LSHSARNRVENVDLPPRFPGDGEEPADSGSLSKSMAKPSARLARLALLIAKMRNVTPPAEDAEQ